jgi:hypothetical protein
VDKHEAEQHLSKDIERLIVSWRVVDAPTPMNGHLPVYDSDKGNDDGAQPERGGSTLDDQARQRKLAGLRKFLADVDAEVAELKKARSGFITTLNESLVKMLPSGDKGGVFAFPVDAVTAQVSSTWDFSEWWVNGLDRPPGRVAAVETTLKNAGLIPDYFSGYCLGHHFEGRCKSPTGSVYDEGSLTLEVLFISGSELIELATELVKEFRLEGVLAKDHATGEVYFVDGK